MMQCTDCGARNARNATFCVRCGAELVQAEENALVGEDTDRLDPVTDQVSNDDLIDMGDTSPEPEAAEPAPDATLLLDIETDLEELAEGEDDPVNEQAMVLLNEASDLLAAGKSDEAAVRCRDAISLAPDLVAAYSLLGMAEEQRGNVVAAAGAYRRVLQLDPDRRVEREKLELLHASGSPSDPDWGADDEASTNPLMRHAPWVAAVGAAFLVLMILTGVGWRGHLQRQAEYDFATSMEAGQQALDHGDYQVALQSFESAVALRPEDPDAQQALRYARRKLTTASRTDAQPLVTQPVPHSATLLPSRGPNPFQPIPIGPTRDAAALEESQQALGMMPTAEQPQPARPAAPRPPVVTPERVTGSTSPPAQARSREQSPPTSVPFGPLEVVEGPAATAPQGDAAAQSAGADQEAAQEAAPPKRRGEISIWVSETPPETRAEKVEATPPARSTEHADRARDLRSSATRARQQGNHARAVELYDQAIDSYRRDSQQNPSNRAANDAAIAACQRARALSGSEGQ